MHSSGPDIDLRLLQGKQSDFSPGKIVNSQTPLAELRNVGGGTFLIGSSLANIPFVWRALELLNEDPLQDEPDENILLKTTTDRWHEHIAYLEYVGVFENFNSYWRLRNEQPVPIFSKYFAVLKREGQARAILDMRTLNSISTTRGVPFSLLGINRFIERLRSLDFRKLKLRIVHADIANAYFQIPIGPNLRKRGCLSSGSQILQCTVLPMGYDKACGICQGIVWGVLLNINEDQRKRLGVPDYIYEETTAPACVELLWGGMLVLVYDSLLLVAPKSHIAEWVGIVKKNFEIRATLRLKYIESEGIGSIFTYCGVKIGITELGVQWTLDDAILKVWKQAAEQDFLPTPRSLYALLGFLRFAYSVLNFDRALLGRFTRIQSTLGAIQKWDEVIPALSKTILSLKKIVERF